MSTAAIARERRFRARRRAARRCWRSTAATSDPSSPRPGEERPIALVSRPSPERSLNGACDRYERPRDARRRVVRVQAAFSQLVRTSDSEYREERARMAHRSIDIAPTAGVRSTGDAWLQHEQDEAGRGMRTVFHLRLIGMSEESGVRCAC